MNFSPVQNHHGQQRWDLYLRSPHYFQLIGESPNPTPDPLPAGKTEADREVIGLWDGPRLEGLVELLRGYPSSEVAYLGLLLVSQDQQKKGWARRLWRAAQEKVSLWPEIERFRLAVVVSNTPALQFWRHLGFAETGEVRPYGQTQVILMELEFRPNVL